MNQVLSYPPFIRKKKKAERGSGALQIYFQAQGRIKVLLYFHIFPLYPFFALFRELEEHSNSDLTGVKVKDFVKEVIYPK